ncbi:hypothetical protein GGI02_003113, partial [Coemansia sp. RSA 2322]
ARAATPGLLPASRRGRQAHHAAGGGGDPAARSGGGGGIVGLITRPAHALFFLPFQEASAFASA